MLVWPTDFPFAQLQDLLLALTGKTSTEDSNAGILPTAQQLSDMLSVMHASRFIELLNVFPVEGSFSGELRLSNSLRRLVLGTSRKDQATSCVQLWSRLIVPPQTNIIIDIRQIELDKDLVDLLRESFARPDSGFQSHPIEVVIGNGSLLLLGSGTFKSPCSASPNRILDRGMELYDINDWNTGPNALLILRPSVQTNLTFHRLINFVSTRVVHLSRGVVESQKDPLNWIEALPDTLSVERVVLPITTPSMSLLFAMARTGNKSSSTGSYFKLFPLLRTITLHYEDDYIKDKDTELSLIVNVLIFLILIRQEGGSPIQLLQVASSTREWPVWLSVQKEIPISWF